MIFPVSSKQAEYKMAKRDYYEVLGVGKNADDKELKSAFRKMAKQYHPDANPDDSTAEQKFKEASEAYEVLKEPQKASCLRPVRPCGVRGWPRRRGRRRVRP